MNEIPIFVYEVIEDQGELYFSLGIFSSREKAIDYASQDPAPSVDGIHEGIWLEVREHELDKEGHANYRNIFRRKIDE